MAVFYGSIGDDNISGFGAEDDTIYGREGNDVLDGLAGNDNLYGEAGDDSLIGGIGNDTLSGGTGNDQLDGGTGSDSMTGGEGNDNYTVDDESDVVTEGIYFGGTDHVTSSISYVLGANVENLTLTGASALEGVGNGAANVITGNTAGNILLGFGGNDTLNGGAGADTMSGGTGNDQLNGGAGDDAMTGGAGDDIYFVNTFGDTTTESAGEGTDTVRSSISWTLSANVENLTLTGTSAVNGTGNGLNNVIRGNSGANVLAGSAGNDTLLGSAGNDVVSSGTGSDWLEGGVGRDVFNGGDGADRFVFRNGDFAGLTAATSDRINDFSQAQGDTLRLDLVDANALVGGDQAFDFIGTAGFNNVAGELRYQIINGNTYVYGDTNGDGVADFMISLVGSHALTGGDFVI